MMDKDYINVLRVVIGLPVAIFGFFVIVPSWMILYLPTLGYSKKAVNKYKQFLDWIWGFDSSEIWKGGDTYASE